ncbi:MAG TPA: hypothetical protein PKB07_25905, partial [Flavilitoribacter sp.]|nr:hypothetical protein [Flavilitoribacter sp.]
TKGGGGMQNVKVEAAKQRLFKKVVCSSRRQVLYATAIGFVSLYPTLGAGGVRFYSGSLYFQPSR